MIELGLARISRLLPQTPLPWRAIHVAGTNGKGSVCAYASAMLKKAEIRCGRFTSPHLIDRWDCISIDEKPVEESRFLEAEATVKDRDRRRNIKASEFELLTATAFEIFAQEKIEVGVIEVGMGGRYDATNAITDPYVTVITKIGLDHQSFLGETVKEIAYQKAGIIKTGVTCIVDGTNTSEVFEVLKSAAEEFQAGPTIRVPQDLDEGDCRIWNTLRGNSLEPHQQSNICLAFAAVKTALEQSHPSVAFSNLLNGIEDTVWPGRLQRLSIESLTGREESILLDGAHNAQSAQALDLYVRRKMRKEGLPVTWLTAFSKGKDIEQMLSCLARPGDNLIALHFGPVDGMPWVQSEHPQEVTRAARKIGILDHAISISANLKGALRLASEQSEGGPLVVMGSLYLVSDVLRLLREDSKELEIP